MEELMRIVGLLAGMIVLSTLPAYSQVPPVNLWKDDKPALSEEEKEKNRALDKAYKDATEKIPKKNVAADPWGNVRGADQKQTKTPTPRN
jgi:hypothetical protein